MKNILKYLIFGFVVFLNTNQLSAYNRPWTPNEQITKPCPGPGCEDECKSKCGCNPDGSEKTCDCEPGACCVDLGGGPNGGPTGAPWGQTGSPVYLKSGFFTWSDTDVSLVSKPTLKLTRSYTAFDSHLGLFGNSWISGFERLFIKTVKYSKDNLDVRSAETFYILRQPDSSRFYFKYDEQNNAFIDMGKIKLIANKIDDHHTTLTYPNNMVETYENGYLIERKDKNGNLLVLNYDTTHLLQSIQSGNATLNLTYNTNGFVSEVTDQTGRIWSYTYDANGNLSEVTDPTGATKTYSYQAHKLSYDAQISYLLTNISDGEGSVIIHVNYDTKGRVSSYTEGSNTYTYTYQNANTVSKRDNAGHTITYTLDNNGVITKVTDPLNAQTQGSYNEANRTLTTIDDNGNSWVKQQDEIGRTIASIDPLGNKTTYTYEGDNTRPSTITSPLGHVTTMTYDAKQNQLTVTDAKSNTQSFKYDAKGNAIEITDAKGAKTAIVYNANNQPTSITNALGYATTIAYDALGRQQSITDAEARTTTYEYDDMDRIVKTTDAIGNVVEYTYDKAGRLTSLKDPVGNTTTYTYDTYGRVATETRPDGGVTSYAYNTDNTIKTITRRDGKVVNYTYDAAKRPISQSVDGDTISYTYDAEGNILTTTNTMATVSFEYDETGKLTKETQLGIDITTSYDAESNVKTLSFLTQTVNYSRDALGLATNIDTTAFTYDANSIQTKLDYGNGTSEANTFDAIYNIKKIQTANETLDYTQDKTGLITSKNSTDYTYDNIGRLTQAGSDSFNYDAAGNNLNDNAVYNILNNRLSASDIYTVTYDSMGNIKSKHNKLTNTTSNYTFNTRNQLVSYEKLDDANQTTKALNYTYDAFNRRVSKTEDGVEQKYLYDGDDIVAILDSSNAVIATITHDESIDTALSITNANGTFYYHRDHQGSIIALTDSSGTVVESFTYDNHYGNIVNHTKDVETNNPYAYTGRELDTEELYYYRARYYDPSLQRFLGEDPIGFESKDFNFYRYVGNSPVLRNDASGLAGASLGAGASVGGHFGIAGGNISTGLGIGTDGPFRWTTVCFRLGFGFGIFGGAVGNAGLNPFPSDSGCPNNDCTITWSVGAGADVGAGAATGYSGGVGNGGVGAVGGTRAGGGLGFSLGIEICVTESCPL